MTSNKSQLVNKEIDDHFSERYGKANFLSIFGIDESNFSKMISGERKMPKYLKIIMNREKEILRLQSAIKAINPNMSTDQLIKHLESNERGCVERLRTKLDRYESAFRILENVPKMIDATLKKAEEAKQ